MSRKRRSAAREMAAFLVNYEKLMRKEGRCPGCAKAKRDHKHNPVVIPICARHRELRHELAFGKMKYYD